MPISKWYAGRLYWTRHWWKIKEFLSSEKFRKILKMFQEAEKNLEKNLHLFES